MTNKEFQEVGDLVEYCENHNFEEMGIRVKPVRDLLALVGEMRECIGSLKTYAKHQNNDCNPHYGCICGLWHLSSKADRLLEITEGLKK